MGSLGTTLTISMNWYDSERWVCPTSKLHQLPGMQLPLVKGWGCITVSEIVSNQPWLWSGLEECHCMVTFARNLMNLVIWSAVPSHGHMANQLVVSSPDHYRGGVGMRPTKCKPPCPIRFSKCKLLDLAGTLLPPSCKTIRWLVQQYLQDDCSFYYIMASRTKWSQWVGFLPWGASH